jgi:hypothetical protein
MNWPIGRERSAGNWKVLRNRNRCRWKRRNKEYRGILGMWGQQWIDGKNRNSRLKLTY